MMSLSFDMIVNYAVQFVQVDGWGRDKFMDASLLDDPDFGFRVLDVVTFKVEMTVYGELEHTTVTETEMAQRAPNYSLEHSMHQLLQHPTHSDVHFVVGAERVVIAAHKCILMARSAVFYAMFSHEMNEELAGEIVVPDVEVTVLREMLNFLYTGQRTAAEVSQGDLFRVAVKYQLPGLIAQCEEHFIAQLSVDTAVPLLEMADTFGAQQLKIRCMQFIAQHAASITSQSAYQDLDELLLRDVNRLIDAGHKRHR
jgi:speckle-type POZ protein